MNRFDYLRAVTVEDALAALALPGSQIIAGGADLVPLLADNLAAPARLIDISRIPSLDAIAYDPATGLRLGATARLAAIQAHPAVRERYTVLAQALDESASPQIRNLGTIGGNLLQQPRCAYYRDAGFACLRRDGGDVCSAREGDSERHALFGAGGGNASACVAVHPSDAINALAALDASVVLRSSRGERSVPVAEFFTPPLIDSTSAAVVAPDEIVVAVTAPPPPDQARGTYVKLRNRAAYEFAIVSAAAVLALEGDRVAHARLVLGGVAWGPWRARAAEAALGGGPLTAERAAEAARVALESAEPLKDNAYKIQMARVAARRALLGEVRAPALAAMEARA